MKKKEILIIFLLAVLVTGLGWFKLTAPPCITRCHAQRGFPLPIWEYSSSTIPGESEVLGRFIACGVVLDFLFWFLVLAVGLWVMKKLRLTKS